MIGIFNDCYPPILDGVALTAKNYAYWLHKKGQEVCVVTPDAPGMPDEEGYPILHYQSVPIPMRKPYRFGLPVMDVSFMKKVNAVQFDLIHAHCPFTSGRLGLGIAHKQNIPIVATFHSKYRQDFERVLPVKAAVDRVIDNIISFYNQVDEVWVPQAAVADVIREYGYKGHLEIVDNGNDFVMPGTEVKEIRHAMRERLGLKQGETMLLFVGQHIWEKNIGFILEALALKKHIPFHLYMVGTGYAVKGIREKIEMLQLQDKVTMVGTLLDREELKSYYAAADLFLFPSLYDNAPLVVREAAAMHTPSLMLAESTASEIIQADKNGFLVTNDVQVYADMVEHLISHPSLMKDIGKEASKTIARSWEDIVDEVVMRYEEIKKRKRLAQQ